MVAQVVVRSRHVIVSTRARIGERLDALEDLTALARRGVGALRTVSPLGRAVALIGAAAWIGGWALGWLELMIVAGACLFLFAVGLLFIAGRAALPTTVVLEPRRVAAGDPSAGSVTVTNASARRTVPLQVVLPIGRSEVVFAVSSLGRGQQSEDLFVVPTERRGVIPVGPPTTVRSDPLGLLQRQAPTGEAQELIVHPRTIPLAPFGSGLLRDLEGITTKDLSNSDLAFHALREYVAGDDRRHIHWRSSAKVGQLLVRQFQDTRRSTFCAVVDGNATGYGDPGEFEVALQVAGSVALRACRDELPAVLAAADQAASGIVPHVLLDALARAELGGNRATLAELTGRVASRGSDISVAVVLSGSACPDEQLLRAAARFSPDVRVLSLRVVPGEPPAARLTPRGALLQLGTLEDLPGLLRGEGDR